MLQTKAAWGFLVGFGAVAPGAAVAGLMKGAGIGVAAASIVRKGTHGKA